MELLVLLVILLILAVLLLLLVIQLVELILALLIIVHLILVILLILVLEHDRGSPHTLILSSSSAQQPPWGKPGTQQPPWGKGGEGYRATHQNTSAGSSATNPLHSIAS